MANDKFIDMHVHMVGNGRSGSGCWLRLKGWHMPLANYMLHHIGMPHGLDRADFDELYVEHLLRLIRETWFHAAVILAHERVYDENGKLLEHLGSFHVPNNYVLKLAKAHPEFLAAVSIHPGRTDAIAELDRCVAEGAVMLKILPNCHNIECSNPRYKKFWERMAELGLPLLSHTGGENTVQVVRKDLEDPRILQLPLECGVTVIAAHCATRSSPGDTDFFPVVAEMMQKHPKLYGDISAMNLPIRSEHIADCLKPPLVDRMVHGSDYPVPILGCWAWWRGFLDWQTARKCDRIPNVLQRDYDLKRAMGFPDAVFSRVHQLLRLPTRAQV
jgi:predicted TIM-barrel fold metal-dependent hydrolase